MNEKGKVLAILGLVIVLSSYVFNELFMMLFLENSYIPEGPIPHSGPILVGTAWLSLIPFGIMLLFAALVFEMRDRFHRKDTNEIWD
ncbi:MAG: hypothetical protein ACTSR9_18345 [Candidatus Thorarchaeota archaeon]